MKRLPAKGSWIGSAGPFTEKWWSCTLGSVAVVVVHKPSPCLCLPLALVTSDMKVEGPRLSLEQHVHEL